MVLYVNEKVNGVDSVKLIMIKGSALPFQNSDIPTNDDVNDVKLWIEIFSSQKICQTIHTKTRTKLCCLEHILNDIHDKTTNVTTQQLQKGLIKTSLSVQIHLVKVTPNFERKKDDEPNIVQHTYPDLYFTSNTEAILNKSQITGFLKKVLCCNWKLEWRVFKYVIGLDKS